MNTTPKAYIRGLGYHVPERVLTNQELERMVDTSDEWITTRTGIKERHIASGETTSDLALVAARKALDSGGLAVEELTHLYVSTLTPDTYCPSTACRLEEKLGIRHRVALDVNAACSGFLYTLQVARATVCLEPDAKVLVAPAEILSYRTNWTDRRTCVLFGDGAGATVVTATGHERNTAEIVDIQLSSDGSLADLLTVRGGGSMAPYKPGEIIRDDFFIQMNGREVYKHAVRNMEAVALEVLGRNGLGPDDVDVLIPHQANGRIIEAVAKRLGVEDERLYVNVDRYGNTSAAAVAIALTEAWEKGVVRPGHKVLLVTFGGGFTWGAALFQF